MLLIFFHISFGKSDPKLITFDTVDIDNTTKEITISFVVPEKDFIYKDFISCSVHEPEVTLSTWKTDQQNINYYDSCFNDTKQVFDKTFSISVTATTSSYFHAPVHLYCSYYRKMDNKINDALFIFFFEQHLDTSIQIHDADIAITAEENNNTPVSHAYYSPLDKYYFTCIAAIRHAITFFIIHHKKCFFLLVIITLLFLLLFHFYQEQLRRYKKLYEIVEMIISLFVVTGITYLLVYVYTIHKPIGRLLATSTSILFSTITGFFYIKKSTKVSIRSLRTFYTCIGIFFMSSTLLLAFKTLQYCDEYMQLFP